MGSSPVPNSSSSGCCDMSLKCWCRWILDHCFLSASFLFFLFTCSLLGLVAWSFAWLTFPHFDRPPLTAFGCQQGNEGSWAIGVFYGDSPFTLKPIEDKNIWKDESAAWPVANPVITCATASDSGYPSNFVADPFLFVQDDIFYLFFETKNSVTMQGDIGVAKSNDKGASWQHLGMALDEEWHLSYPYVFRHLDQIFMLPESRENGELRLYRALDFPLQWTVECVILKKPLVDSFIIYRDGYYWLFGSDFSGFTTRKNGQLEIWYSNSLVGTWKPHKQNPIYNSDNSIGARNGGRPFVHNGSLYRVGQDCGESYGRRLRVFRIEVLAEDEYREVEVQYQFKRSDKGRNSWNGARHHHLDAQPLPSGEWIAVMDGDRVPSGDPVQRLLLGLASITVVVLLATLVALLVGAIRCLFPRNWCHPISVKRSDSLTPWDRDGTSFFFLKLRKVFARLNRAILFVHGKVKINTCAGRFVLGTVIIVGAMLFGTGVRYIYGGNGAEEAYPFKGHYSQFTLLTMTYEARLWNLKMYIKHYSRCSSVSEIVVVWNKGQPPDVTTLNSVVPVRIRVEKQNSLNNRFKVDHLIKTRAVLELDDDIMMTCDDLERGFYAWRQHPERIVGYYPRLIDGSPLKYKDEHYARAHGEYNVILTGAAFMDSRFAFERYWKEDAREGREMVDNYFNCEDVLMNFLYANGSTSRMVEYVKPAWAIDTSKISGAAISRNTKVHYQKRSSCLVKFSQLYGNLAGRKWQFNSRNDGWDV